MLRGEKTAGTLFPTCGKDMPCVREKTNREINEDTSCSR